jgi:Tol biopolymer transport system component
MIDAAVGSGRNAKQITDKAGSTAVSPDGKYLVFQSSDDNDKNAGLFRLNLRDGEKKRLTTGADIWATFSPDGKWIVYTRWAEQVALWKVSIDGGEAVKLTNVTGAALAPSVSPDGKFIAFYWLKENRRLSPEIVLLPFDGSEIIKSFVVLHGRFSQNYGKDALQWTPDGQAVNFISHRDGVSNIWRQPIDGSSPVQVTNFTSGQIFNFAYSPDGSQLALSRGTFSRDVVLIKNSE